MSFGYSTGDFIAICQLTWSVYKSCKEAPESFVEISVEVLSLHALLKEVEELLADQPLPASKQNSLNTIASGYQDVLRDLQALMKKHESLGSKSKRKWDRMRWVSNDIAELRQRLTSNTMLLAAFMSTLQIMVERKLNDLIQEFQDGKRAASVISITSVKSLTLDDKQMWGEIRKELESIGISVAAFDANKTFILKWFQKAVETGAFKEQGPNRDSDSMSSGPDSRPSSQSSEEYIDASQGVILLEDDYQVSRVHHMVRKEEKALTSETTVVQANTPGDGLSRPRNSTKPKRAQRLKKGSMDDAVKQPVSHSDNTMKKVQTSTPFPEREVPKIVSFVARLLNFNASFLEACNKKRIHAATRLLKTGADVDARSVDGYYDTALIQMCKRGFKTTMVKFLLENGAEINAQGSMGTTLHAAIKKLDIDMVTLLCERGANLQSVSPYYTPLRLALHCAIEIPRSVLLDIAKLLIEKGASISKSDISYCLLYAVEKSVYSNQIDNTRFLLDQGADVNHQHQRSTTLHAAAKLADHLFEWGCGVADYEKANTKLRVLKMLLEKNLELEKQDAYGYTALDYAIRGDAFTVAEFLLDNGAVDNFQRMCRSPFKPEEKEYASTNEEFQKLHKDICGGYLRFRQKSVLRGILMESYEG